MNLNEMISIDLPSLQSITLGKYALDGSNKSESMTITVKQPVHPEEVTIDQTYSYDEHEYLFAIADKQV